jgi:CheY-like chemotaxis protein
MKKQVHVLLADDDEDDRFFFAKALNQLAISTKLDVVEDGEKLIAHLMKTVNQPPDILFLDINMPRKRGSDCLIEIKANKSVAVFPIIIYSTYLSDTMLDELYENGAHYCLQKGDLPMLVKSLHYLLERLIENNFTRPSKDHFIIDLQKVQ